jgi:hypothetical protein
MEWVIIGVVVIPEPNDGNGRDSFLLLQRLIKLFNGEGFPDLFSCLVSAIVMLLVSIGEGRRFRMRGKDV